MQGTERPQIDHLSDEDLVANALGFQSHLRDLAREISKWGGTCMRLVAEDGISSCTEQLEEFLQIVRIVAEAKVAAAP